MSKPPNIISKILTSVKKTSAHQTFNWSATLQSNHLKLSRQTSPPTSATAITTPVTMVSVTTYTGPSAREMFESHTLGKEIISRADDAEPILDASELALLKRYVTAPESKSDILKELGFLDADGIVVAAKAQGNGSLVTYIMIQSVAGNDLLSDEEIAELKAWFSRA